MTELPRCNQPVLAGQTADLVALGLALIEQLRTNAVNRLDVLLRDALDRQKVHTRAVHRLATARGSW